MEEVFKNVLDLLQNAVKGLERIKIHSNQNTEESNAGGDANAVNCAELVS